MMTTLLWLYLAVAAYWLGEFNGAPPFRDRPTWGDFAWNVAAAATWPVGLAITWTIAFRRPLRRARR
jgi:hypothetical protein